MITAKHIERGFIRIGVVIGSLVGIGAGILSSSSNGDILQAAGVGLIAAAVPLFVISFIGWAISGFFRSSLEIAADIAQAAFDADNAEKDVPAYADKDFMDSMERYRSTGEISVKRGSASG